ncbi:MAG: hypothetical protein GY781_02300 [Gammaproteobacteria bacterium]|nr:hypothetical protein [Gammaproteobacteria bacterium]
MNTKAIIATVVAITAVLFVVPANADLVAVDNNRLFVAFTNDPTSNINCDVSPFSGNGLWLNSGVNRTGTDHYVNKSSNLVSTNFDNKAQSLITWVTTKGIMSSTWAICMDDDYQECWKLEQSDFSCDSEYCTINDLGSFLNGSAKNNISSVVMLSCPGAEPRKMCTKDGQCSEYIPVAECQAERTFPEKCLTLATGSDVPAISSQGCTERGELDCFEWISEDCAKTYPDCE